MIYYILPTCIAVLSFGVLKPTTLRFDSHIEYISLGEETQFVTKLSKNKKLLTLKPMKSLKDIPLVVVTKKGDFQFQGSTTDSKYYSQFIDIKEGRVSRLFQNVYSDKELQVLEGKESLRVINKGKKPMMVNGVSVMGEVDTCKGAPVIVNGREIKW